LGIFPFDFKIIMHVVLTDRTFHIDVKIKHNRPKLNDCILMPVASGWHPYFSLDQKPAQVQIPARTVFPVTAQGAAGKPTSATSMLSDPPWTLPHADLKSLILSDLTSQESTLKTFQKPDVVISSGPAAVMNHIVTWSNQVQDFICIEPWMSLPDAVATPSGCKWLAAGETLSMWLDIKAQI
jgi:galactose mutarotase-like enzyme